MASDGAKHNNVKRGHKDQEVRENVLTLARSKCYTPRR